MIIFLGEETNDDEKRHMVTDFFNKKRRGVMQMKCQNETVSVKKITEDAENYFRKGFYCCEAVMAAILDNFEPAVPREVIAMSSGMAVGAGKTGCMCGALNGGILVLGMFFGRTEPLGKQDPQSVKCLELVKELHDWFLTANGKHVACCRALIAEFKGGDHSKQCIHFTGLCAGKTAEIIVRELGFKNLDE